MAPDHELDTSLPGVRLLQQWIRQRRTISIQLASGLELQGRLLWQDSEFLAVLLAGAERPELLVRRRIERIRSLDGDPSPATMPTPRLPLPPI